MTGITKHASAALKSALHPYESVWKGLAGWQERR
jgi:hypothetical protein